MIISETSLSWQLITLVMTTPFCKNENADRRKSKHDVTKLQ